MIQHFFNKSYFNLIKDCQNLYSHKKSIITHNNFIWLTQNYLWQIWSVYKDKSQIKKKIKKEKRETLRQREVSKEDSKGNQKKRACFMKNQKAVETLEIQNITEHPLTLTSKAFTIHDTTHSRVSPCLLVPPHISISMFSYNKQ